MLIEFSIKNYRSIKERQTLSLVSTSSQELRETNTTAILGGKQSLVRSAVIYGPNASGKTNIVKALNAMREIVLRSAQRQRGDELFVTPYLFDAETQQLPTEFEVVFISQGVRYQYGFAATLQQVFEEWLYAYPKGRAQTWIDRTYHPETGQTEWGANEKLTGTKELWQEATRDNALFLSTAIQLNNKQLQPVFDWFESLHLWGTGNVLPIFTVENSHLPDNKNKILEFLKSADFAIADFDVKRTRIPVEQLNLSSEQMERLRNQPGNAERIEVQTIHIGNNGERFSLHMDEESDGTKKFFALAGPLLYVLQEGKVLVVDELSEHLHPRLLKYLVQLFHDEQVNPHNAQLIFTTHETSILSQEVFRRDQIWFTEKDEYNATTLYPLSDFKPRKGVENLEKGYLQGRYGALPYFRTIERLMNGAHG